MINKIKAFWASLPHQIQGGIIAVASAVAGVLVHHYSDPAAWSLAEVKHEVVTALAAGVGALRVFFMLPNTPSVEPPKQ